MNAPRRSIATASVALAVLTAGLTLAFVEAAPHSGAAAVVPALDRSVSVGAGFRVGLDNGGPVASRPGASDVPRVFPLSAPFRGAVHTA